MTSQVVAVVRNLCLFDDSFDDFLFFLPFITIFFKLIIQNVGDVISHSGARCCSQASEPEWG